MLGILTLEVVQLLGAGQEGFILMNGDRWYLKEKSPCDVLHKFIEIFDGKGWLNKKLRIKYQGKRYWIS